MNGPKNASEGKSSQRVLISAYACEPYKGSEPEVGLQTVLLAAERAEVHVITRANNVASLEAYLSERAPALPIQVIGIDLPTRAQRLKKSTGRLGFYWYYDRWQALAQETARELHAEVGFDLAHHVTLATYWQRSITSAVDVPSVLGPVGGGPSTPWRLLPELGARGIVGDVLRFLVQRLWETRPSVRRSLASATVTLAQNPETARRIRSPGKTVIAPNGSSASVDEPIFTRQRNEIVVIGRMIPYKAGALALRAFSLFEQPDVQLVFIGDGPDRRRLERIVAKKDLANRVQFLGRLPRQETLERLAGAKALLHPALHDDSPLTVAEALSLGTRVVCLDRGGPPVLCALWPEDLSEVVPITTRSQTTRELAAALSRVVLRAPTQEQTPIDPRRTFTDQILDAYDDALEASS